MVKRGMYGGSATVAGTIECNDMGYWRFLPCFKTGVSSPRLIMKALAWCRVGKKGTEWGRWGRVGGVEECVHEWGDGGNERERRKSVNDEKDLLVNKVCNK